MEGGGTARIAPFDASSPLRALSVKLAGLDLAAFTSAPQTMLAVEAELAPSGELLLAGPVKIANSATGPLDRNRLPVASLAANLAVAKDGALKARGVEALFAGGGSAKGDLAWARGKLDAALDVKGLEPARVVHAASRDGPERPHPRRRHGGCAVVHAQPRRSALHDHRRRAHHEPGDRDRAGARGAHGLGARGGRTLRVRRQARVRGGRPARSRESGALREGARGRDQRHPQGGRRARRPAIGAGAGRHREEPFRRSRARRPGRRRRGRNPPRARRGQRGDGRIAGERERCVRQARGRARGEVLFPDLAPIGKAFGVGRGASKAMRSSRAPTPRRTAASRSRRPTCPCPASTAWRRSRRSCPWARRRIRRSPVT